MAIKTQDWDTFIALTKARAGAQLKNSELADIGVLANAAARTINDYSSYWPRLLELQERSVVNGVVAYSEDSYEVKGAGTTEVNGLYQRVSTVNSYPAYQLNPSSDSSIVDADFSLYFDDNNGVWVINDGGIPLSPPGRGDDTKYSQLFGSETPDQGSWLAFSGQSGGDDPAPIITALDDIDQAIQVWNAGPCTDDHDRSRTKINNWYAGPDGLYLGNCDYDTVFVGFKKDLTDVYGDGTGGTVSEIPFEWTDYMSYSAARVLQDGQRNGTEYVGIALRQIDEVLNNQLMRVNKANAMNVFTRMFDTYYNNDYSTR